MLPSCEQACHTDAYVASVMLCTWKISVTPERVHGYMSSVWRYPLTQIYYKDHSLTMILRPDYVFNRIFLKRIPGEYLYVKFVFAFF